MNQNMASLSQSLSNMFSVIIPHVHYKHVKLCRSQIQPNGSNLFSRGSQRLIVCCTNQTPWEPPPITFASVKKSEGKFLPSSTSIFETVSSNEAPKASSAKEEEIIHEVDQKHTLLQYFRWPMWLLGPAMLLVTGMVPTLWLPLSSVFLGPNIASLLALTGLDCIFNLGACLFLLVADSCAHDSKPSTQRNTTSKPPFSYQFWNMVANIIGFAVPWTMLYGSHKCFLQPQLPFISFAVLLGPYLLLLSVQILTEALTWHWQSPVWLVTPVVYEAYRLLQMMRGLKLSAELSAPPWMMHTIKGLVCWWVLVLGVQLMRVAWYAGFKARAKQQLSSLVAADSD